VLPQLGNGHFLLKYFPIHYSSNILTASINKRQKETLLNSQRN
jgi:hypothetical protein